MGGGVARRARLLPESPVIAGIARDPTQKAKSWLSGDPVIAGNPEKASLPRRHGNVRKRKDAGSSGVSGATSLG